MMENHLNSESKRLRHNEVQRQHRLRHPEYREKQKESIAKFKAAHPDYFRNQVRLWKKEHPDKHYEKCKRWRKKHPDKTARQRMRYAQRNPNKKQARNLVRYFPLGSECEECGATERLERHHSDYSKPREFQTLCHDCHKSITNIQGIEGIKA